MMNSDLLRIMYAPLDYIHSNHFAAPTVTLTPALEQAINHTLIQRYALSTEINFLPQSSDFSLRLVSEWKNIPAAAWLLGCKLARGSLARSGQLATLPTIARRFIELPIACPAIELATPLVKSSLAVHGGRYLFLLKQNLPAALGQRLPLFFESDMAVEHHRCTLNRSLLTFAFDYAKNSIH
jgi:type III secretion system OrgA/MxiK family protein